MTSRPLGGFPTTNALSPRPWPRRPRRPSTARAHRRPSPVADMLQRGLLPPRRPRSCVSRWPPTTSPGRHACERAGTGTTSPPLTRRTAIAVGDVVGHGAQAAAVMAQLRAALSAILTMLGPRVRPRRGPRPAQRLRPPRARRPRLHRRLRDHRHRRGHAALGARRAPTAVAAAARRRARRARRRRWPAARCLRAGQRQFGLHLGHHGVRPRRHRAALHRRARRTAR